VHLVLGVAMVGECSDTEVGQGNGAGGAADLGASPVVGRWCKAPTVSFQDDDATTLDLVLGQAHHLLGDDGDVHAQQLVQSATLRVQRDGGYFNPIPGDNWTDATYEAVLCVEPNVVPEFTPEVTDRIWSKLEAVLRGRDRIDVFGLVVEANVPPLPEIGEDWRAGAAHAAAEVPPSNQARRERAHGGHPERDGLTLASRAEAVVYDALAELQRSCTRHRTIAVAPLPGVKLRDAGVRTPDFLVLGNGRAVVIEVDGVHHYGTTRKADDADRDRHWSRCDVPTLRIGAHHADEPEALRELLVEELRRLLWRT